MNDNPSMSFAGNWENFWRSGEQKSDKRTTMPCFGGQAENLSRSWHELLQPYVRTANQNDVVIDVAAGNGVVIYSLLQLLLEHRCPDIPELICTDYSLSACQEALSRDKRIASVCAKTEALPFDDGSADLVLSQFGIEYSGDAGFAEAFRLLRVQGRFCAVCHIKDGVIYNECLTHFNASRAFYDSNIFTAAESVFTQANLVLQGRAAQATFVEADTVFSHSVNTCKQIFTKYGKGICAGYLFKVFAELGQMFNNIQQYQLSDVLAWLENNRNEMLAYSGRMESMTQSALSEESINRIFSQLEAQYSREAVSWQYRPLFPEALNNEGNNKEQTLPVAWIIEMTKGNIQK